MRHALTLIVLMMITVPAAAQTPPPWKAENLQYFPKDISRAQLTQRMREFSLALGVRCQYCHTGGNGVSLEGVSFASDEKPAKVKARAMLRMVERLNTVALAELPTRAEPRVEIGCATCHRTMALPKSLQTTLLEVIEKDGIAPAVAKYRELRRDTLVLGRYNFDEWEMNELARRLSEANNVDAAIAMLELNGEFNPKSAAIDVFIGEHLLRRGEREKAAQRYRAALEKEPDNRMVKQRLADLEKKPE